MATMLKKLSTHGFVKFSPTTSNGEWVFITDKGLDYVADNFRKEGSFLSQNYIFIDITYNFSGFIKLELDIYYKKYEDIINYDLKCKYDIGILYSYRDASIAKEILVELEKINISALLTDGKNCDIIINDCTYCLLLISTNYYLDLTMNWCSGKLIQRGFFEFNDFILPVKITDIDIDSLLNTTGYVDWKNTGARKIASLVKIKLNDR